ncbi:MAG: low-complexity tail membrane protein [Cyanobacteria bacterium J06621_3]
MIQLQQNRYLWVHVVSLAAVPLLLDVCLAGLASAGPALAFGGQFWAIALLGVVPALAMQWLKPFYVFSIPPLALKPAALSEDQRRCLTIFKSWQIKALAVVVAFFSVWVLGKVYGMLPQVSPLLTPKAGLICGAIAFFFAATFMQISVSAIRALLIGPEALKRVQMVEERAIASDFLILGIPVKKLLPEASQPDDAKPNGVERDEPAPVSTKSSKLDTGSEKTRPDEAVQVARAAESLEKETLPAQDEVETVDDSDDMELPVAAENRTEIEQEKLEQLEPEDKEPEGKEPEDKKTEDKKTEDKKPEDKEPEQTEIVIPEILPAKNTLEEL